MKKPPIIPGTVPDCGPIFELRNFYTQTRRADNSSATLNGRIILKRGMGINLVIFEDSN
jgi:hypothetical protein